MFSKFLRTFKSNLLNHDSNFNNAKMAAITLRWQMNFIQDNLIYAKKITVGQTPKVSEFWLSKNVRTLKNVHLSVIIQQNHLRSGKLMKYNTEKKLQVTQCERQLMQLNCFQSTDTAITTTMVGDEIKKAVAFQP